MALRERLPLLLDCDNTFGVPGCDVDDGLALLYLLGSPEAELLGVTCSYGNSTQETVYRNTLRLLRAWGREDIPVLRGAEGAADRRSEAAEFLAETARKRAGALCVVATGAMTNLLGAEETDPGFFSRVRAFSLMGGVTGPLLVGGRPMAELNLSCDPAASLAVLRQGKRVRVATAQNCLRSYFPREECAAALREGGGALGAYLERHLADWFEVYEKSWALPGFVNWDVMAAAQLLHPELFALREAEIGPTEESLRRGLLPGPGSPQTVLLPELLEPETYRRHVYQTWLSAPVALAGEQ